MNLCYIDPYFQILHKTTATNETIGVISDQEKMNCLFLRSGLIFSALPLSILIYENIRQRLEFYFK